MVISTTSRARWEILWFLLVICFNSVTQGTAFLQHSAQSTSQNLPQQFIRSSLKSPVFFNERSELMLLKRSERGGRRNRGVARQFLARQDNLVSGLAEIFFAFSIGVLWSELSIIRTGCGPLHFSDTLERICYQGVIVSAGLALFNRIVTRGERSLRDTSEEIFGPLEEWTLWQVDVMEYSSVLAVLGAFVALGVQSFVREANMNGLSGIDVELCRAIRDL